MDQPIRCRTARRGRPFRCAGYRRPPISCVFCGDSTGLKVSCGPFHYYAHIRCRRTQRCCYCGEGGMTKDFGNSLASSRLAHPWCMKSSVLKLTDHNIAAVLDVKNRISEAVSDPELLQAMRKHDLEFNKTHRKCTGSVLWYYIGDCYFPAFTDTEDWPNFTEVSLCCEERTGVVDSFRREEWQSAGVDSEIRRVEQALQVTRQSICVLKQSARRRHSRCADLLQFTESLSDSHLILAELELLEHADVRSQYVAYVQRKQRNPTAPIPRDLEAPRKEYNCGVCLGGTSEDRNPIMICSLCDESTHVRCYGLQTVPEDDWVCDMCKALGKHRNAEMQCALCSTTGGLMKETVHCDNSSSHKWCHVLCALYVPGVYISPHSEPPKVLYSLQDTQNNPLRKCDICGVRSQFSVSCEAKGCGFTFHPGCGKVMLVSGWRRGPEVGEVLCKLHKPLPLIKRSQDARRRKAIELVSFAKYWESDNVSVGQVSCKRDRPWEFREVEALEALVAAKINAVNERFAKEFRLTVTLRGKGYVRCVRPEGFNLISREMLTAESVSLPSRSAEECVDFYCKTLMDRMKRELTLASSQFRVYAAVPQVESDSEDEPVRKPRVEKKLVIAKKAVRSFLLI